MSLLKQLVATGGVSTPPTYVDDVFSAYLYSGTGSSQTITNGIDLAGKGGLVWLKDRTSANPNTLLDTNRGTSSTLQTHSTLGAGNVSTAVTAFNSNGFTIGTNGNINTNTNSYVSWSFRKATKFFDVVTYTGDGTSSKTIAHNLGQQVGMMIIKRVDATGTWYVYHTALGNSNYLILNNTSISQASSSMWAATSPTTTNFTVGDIGANNVSSATYIAYLFAHNSATDGLIQCGSFTTDASGNASVTLGYEPQYILCKNTTSSEDWFVLDSLRGLVVDGAAGGDAGLSPNLSAVEAKRAFFDPTPTGFTLPAGSWLTVSSTYVYIAIRRSNKPPTSGTQVYNSNNVTGNSSTNRKLALTSFPPDFLLVLARDGGTLTLLADRMRGATKSLAPASTGVEASWSGTNQVISFNQDGVTVGDSISFNETGRPFSYQSFKRAVGVFEIVCYTGDGSASQTISHGLGVAPELIITKNRSVASSWWTYNSPRGKNFYMALESPSAEVSSTNIWGTTAPSSTSFDVNSALSLTTSSNNYITYLFATKAGISKVGSYTGNGSSQNIDCGFAGGARFIMIKRTDAAGNWYMFDSVRGIVAGNDPWLLINTGQAEVTTDDSIDPLAAGFIVNQVAATNINVNTATYIFLAFS